MNPAHTPAKFIEKICNKHAGTGICVDCRCTVPKPNCNQGPAWRKSANAPEECPRWLPWDYTPEAFPELAAELKVTPAPKPDTSCTHRGKETLELIECKICSGSVKAKVVACAIHGRCTEFSKPIEGVKACLGCKDRKAVEKIVESVRIA